MGQTREYERLYDAVCEIKEYPEIYGMARICWRLKDGRRSGAESKPRDVQTVGYDQEATVGPRLQLVLHIQEVLPIFMQRLDILKKTSCSPVNRRAFLSL